MYGNDWSSFKKRIHDHLYLYHAHNIHNIDAISAGAPINIKEDDLDKENCPI